MQQQTATRRRQCGSSTIPVQVVPGSQCMLLLRPLPISASPRSITAKVEADTKVKPTKLRVLKLVNEIDIDPEKAHLPANRTPCLADDAAKAAKFTERFGKICIPPRDYGIWKDESKPHSGIREGLDLREIIAAIDRSKDWFGGKNRRPVRVDNLSDLVYIVLWNGSREAEIVEHDFLAKYYNGMLNDFLMAHGAKVVRRQAWQRSTTKSKMV